MSDDSGRLKKPYIVVVIALAIAVLGGFAYTKIPADLLPQFETPAVQIVCFYPGMPPEVMKKDIMSRLQRWTSQSVDIEHQEAKAMQSVCVVKDFFREGISMDTAMAQVTSYAMSDMYDIAYYELRNKLQSIRQPGANTISIVKQIKRQLSTIEKRLKVERSEDPKMPSCCG